ncbi:MAG TPA: hypothetical protein VHP11_18025, partial [Tepidisphaeraceae bacterium]|nr:hypothetical protein [Tepidisphaeraceae bacterium]
MKIKFPNIRNDKAWLKEKTAKRVIKIRLTKGKLAKTLASSTSGTPPPVPASVSITSYRIFENSIKRAENLFRLGETPVQQQSGKAIPELQDARRAAIVLAVAAL